MEPREDPKFLRMHLVRHYRSDIPSAGSSYRGPYFDGIYIKDLKKGDVVSFEGIVGDYARVRIILRVTFPQHSGVEVAQVVRLGMLSVEVPKRDLGLDRGIQGHFVVRGEIEGHSDLGWIGLGADVRLTPSFKLEAVKNIHINGTPAFSRSSPVIQ